MPKKKKTTERKKKRRTVTKTAKPRVTRDAKGRFLPGTEQPTGAGRKKGTPNRFTALKNAFLDAFDRLGGQTFLIKFVRERGKGGDENRRTFIRSLTKMLPQVQKVQVSGAEEGDPLEVLHRLSDEQLAALVAKLAK